MDKITESRQTPQEAGAVSERTGKYMKDYEALRNHFDEMLTTLEDAGINVADSWCVPWEAVCELADEGLEKLVSQTFKETGRKSL